MDIAGLESPGSTVPALSWLASGQEMRNLTAKWVFVCHFVFEAMAYGLE